MNIVNLERVHMKYTEHAYCHINEFQHNYSTGKEQRTHREVSKINA